MQRIRVISVMVPDGFRLHVEQTGEGVPILFIHEFAGDHRSWSPQVRHLSPRYKCITYAARGYPPSDVPSGPAAYSQDHAVQDALAVLDGLGVDRAHIVGLSMGGFCALHLALRHADRVVSVVAGGVGYGADPAVREAFRAECELIARAFETDGSEQVAAWYALGPSRVQFQRKDPVGHAEFTRLLAEHSVWGSAATMRGVQKERPSLYDLRGQLTAMTTPLLVIVGDEDTGAIDASLMLKRTVPSAGLAVLPRTGHTLNLEEPARFNQLVDDFVASVERDDWPVRDLRSLTTSLMGIDP
jgi:pimeloyl-ACP methyl ester carboxylesterase